MIKDIIIHILRRPSMPNNLALELVTHRNTSIRENTRISFRCYSDP